MSQESSLTFNPNVEASPIYVGGASIEEMQKEYGREDFIKMASNESPIGPSPRAIEAMQQAVTTLNRYPPMGDEALRAAAAEFRPRLVERGADERATVGRPLRFQALAR